MSANNKPTTRRTRAERAADPQYTRDTLPPSRTDWARVDATTDEEIAAQIAEDPDTAPEWTEAMFAEARLVLPPEKVPISLRVDADVLAWYRAQGPRYQSRMHQVLRTYMEADLARSAGAADARAGERAPATAGAAPRPTGHAKRRR